MLKNSILDNLIKSLSAIAEGYPLETAEDRFIVVKNPESKEDNMSDLCLVIDVHYMKAFFEALENPIE